MEPKRLLFLLNILFCRLVKNTKHSYVARVLLPKRVNWTALNLEGLQHKYVLYAFQSFVLIQQVYYTHTVLRVFSVYFGRQLALFSAVYKCNVSQLSNKWRPRHVITGFSCNNNFKFACFTKCGPVAHTNLKSVVLTNQTVRQQNCHAEHT